MFSRAKSLLALMKFRGQEFLDNRKHTHCTFSHQQKEVQMTKQARTLNERELQKLLEFVSKTKSQKRNRAIILLTHLAGMRIGEVAYACS
jgi:integrase